MAAVYNEIKILLSGSRDLTSQLDEYLKMIAITYPANKYILVEGEAKGADSLGRDAALRLGWTVEKFPATRDGWKMYGKSAGHRRNRQMIEQDCDVAIFFPLGLSPGTYGCLKELTKYVKTHSENKMKGVFLVRDGSTSFHNPNALSEIVV
jgi:hypothetical protein